MRFLYQRGEGSRRRVMHLCGYDPRTGNPTMVPLCGERRLTLNTTSNMALRRPVCKRCLDAYLIPDDGTVLR
jgi:hypothetical protein